MIALRQLAEQNSAYCLLELFNLKKKAKGFALWLLNFLF